MFASDTKAATATIDTVDTVATVATVATNSSDRFLSDLVHRSKCGDDCVCDKDVLDAAFKVYLEENAKQKAKAEAKARHDASRGVRQVVYRIIRKKLSDSKANDKLIHKLANTIVAFTGQTVFPGTLTHKGAHQLVDIWDLSGSVTRREKRKLSWYDDCCEGGINGMDIPPEYMPFHNNPMPPYDTMDFSGQTFGPTDAKIFNWNDYSRFCDPEKHSFENSTFKNMEILGTNLNRLNFAGATFVNVTFIKCTMEDVVFCGPFENVRFHRCRMLGAYIGNSGVGVTCTLSNLSCVYVGIGQINPVDAHSEEADYPEDWYLESSTNII
jgi:hypothetical protein